MMTMTRIILKIKYRECLRDLPLRIWKPWHMHNFNKMLGEGGLETVLEGILIDGTKSKVKRLVLAKSRSPFKLKLQH